MTATRELSWTQSNVEGTVDAFIRVVDREEVYFTDQEPQFEITIENNTSLDFSDDSHIAWVIAIGQGRPEPFIREQYTNFTLPSGEERTLEVSGETLSLEGHGIIALGQGSFHKVNQSDGYFKFTAGRTQKDRYEPLATFSVWDREHYEVVHEQPQRTQHLTLFASVGIVFFAILQSGTSLGHPKLGLLGGILILGIYWYSGFMDDLIQTLRETSK